MVGRMMLVLVQFVELAIASNVRSCTLFLSLSKRREKKILSRFCFEFFFFFFFFLIFWIMSAHEVLNNCFLELGNATVSIGLKEWHLFNL